MIFTILLYIPCQFVTYLFIWGFWSFFLVRSSLLSSWLNQIIGPVKTVLKEGPILVKSNNLVQVDCFESKLPEPFSSISVWLWPWCDTTSSCLWSNSILEIHVTFYDGRTINNDSSTLLSFGRHCALPHGFTLHDDDEFRVRAHALRSYPREPIGPAPYIFHPTTITPHRHPSSSAIRFSVCRCLVL